MKAIDLTEDLRGYSNNKRKEVNERYFKTGFGEYGFGDQFIGVAVPEVRKIALKSYTETKLEEIESLLNSKIHEERLLGLLILVYQYKKEIYPREEIFNFYLKNKSRVNNWDLVDTSAPEIVGDYLFKRDKRILYDLAKSKNLWEKRISIISTLKFIRNGEITDCLTLSKIHLKDNHDLMHKAVGWMLRESWKKDSKRVEEFLIKNYTEIPRTTLRYAIEKMNEQKRKNFLKGNF